MPPATVITTRAITTTCKGRIASVEVLLGNNALSNIIREGRVERVSSVFQSGRREGMIMMDDSLDALVKDGTIEGRDAYMKAHEKRRFVQYVEDNA